MRRGTQTVSDSLPSQTSELPQNLEPQRLETFTAHPPVHEQFVRQAAQAPDVAALAAGDCWLSYGEVDRRSNRLARYLRALGVGPEVLVGVALGRSPELVIAQLGVLKAGGAYLSLAPGDPAERLSFMLEDSRVDLLITARSLAATHEHLGIRQIELDGHWSDIERLSDYPLTDLVTPSHRAYVIYTSGSTGRPKGTELVHGGLSHLVAWHRRCYDVGPGERATQVASPAFDASVWEIWPYLTAGATLVFPKDTTRTEPAALYHFLAERAMTRCFLPTPVAEAMLQETLPGGLALKVLLVGGDRLHQPPPSGLPFRLINHYGPTEDTVVSTAGEIAPPSEANADAESFGFAPTIGRPIDRTQAILFDRALRPMPVGDAGELAVGGAGLARGYLRRPSLSAERFVPNPFGALGSRLYRTGDLVSARADGNLDFQGRIDHQVKIRGFRIELGEIEAVLEEHPAVQTCVVLANGQGASARLVAYAVPKAGSLGDELLAFAQERLSAHMVPSAVIELAELPLTPNGKVDRAALGRLTIPRSSTESESSRPPSTPAEHAVAEIWQDLLGAETVGVDENFFALGGHSLLAGRLVSRLRQELDTEVPLADLYAEPTIAALAVKVDAGVKVEALPAVELAPRDQPIPLTFPAERVWFIHQLAPGNIAYNAQATFRFRGPMNPEVYRRVLTEIVRRHEVFRTRFPVRDGQPVQEIDAPMEVELPVIDLSHVDAEQREAYAESVIWEELRRPFEIYDLPLARWKFVRMGPLDHILVQVEFHYVHDGWSFALLLRETKAIYEAYMAGRPSPLPEPPIQYADFAVWQRSWMQGEVLEKYLGYWTQRLAGSPPALELPSDRPRPKAHTFRGAARRVELGPERYLELRQLGREQGVTLFTTMLSTFNVLLHRYTGAVDVLVGTAAANRRTSEIEQMIGMVVNTLVLRSDLSGNPTLSELFQRVQNTWLGAYTYQDMPFDKLVSRLAPDRDLSRNPLFQVMYSFHDSEVPELEFCGLSGDVYERHNGSAKSDLNIITIPRGEQRVGSRSANQQGISLIWEYSTDLFDKTTMERMVGHFKTLLSSAVANPDLRPSELPMLTSSEAQQLRDWSDTQSGDTRRDRESDALLPTLFQAQVEASPQTPAVICGGQQLSYRELDQRSTQLARHLRRCGLASDGSGEAEDRFVAVALQRSVDMLVALLGILKAGGAYLPLDPSFPRERLAFMLEDAEPAVLLTENETLARLPNPLPGRLAERVVRIDTDRPQIEEASTEALPISTHPDQLAYVIYTSGSTGRPKGVQVRHRSLANFLTSMARRPGVTSDDVLLAVTTLSFDIAGLELFLPLVAGGTVVIARRQETTDGERLLQLLASSKATVLQATPATWRLLLAAGWTGDRQLKALCGGEALPPELAADLVEHCGEVWNLYGPTETTVWSAAEKVDGVDLSGRSMSIGRPIDNTEVYLLDPRFAPVPAGIPGDLYLGGEGLARGYLKRPGLTASSFVPDAFSGRSDARLYRTGDVARRRADGRLEFLGRRDFQVKVRGFRIELGEIEAVLAEHPGVRQVVAGVAATSADDARLVAHLVPAAQPPTDDELRAHAQGRLPEYMVPTAFLPTDELPLTPNGKVDRAALNRGVELDVGASRRTFVEPLGPVEGVLASIWSEVLGVERIGREDHFFHLGGHSLLATRVASRLREVFGVEIALRELFEGPTVRQLAQVVTQAREAAPAMTAIDPVAADPELVPLGAEQRAAGLPLSPAQERLWFIDRLIPDRAVYHVARVYSCLGPLSPSVLEAAVREVIRRHEILRTTFVVADGRPEQRVGVGPDPAASILPLIDLSALASEQRQVECDCVRHREVRRLFNFQTGPLQRTTLVRLAEAEHLLLLTQHHIVSDVWSLSVLTRELSTVYGAMLEGQAPALVQLPVQYGDYAVWQRQRQRGAALDGMLAFWREHLEGAPAVLELPIDRPRPALQTFRGTRHWLTIEPELHGRLEDLARQAGATPFMLLLAAWSVVLGRAANQQDVVLGTPIAGRGRREIEDLVGLFVNTLALRCRFDDDPAFGELLGRTRDTLLSAYAHQEVPFEKLVDELVPERNLSHSPLFQALFSLQNLEAEALDLPGLEVTSLEVPRREAHFDLTIFGSEIDGGSRFLLNYNRDLFDAATIARLARQFKAFLRGVALEVDRPVLRAPLLSASDRHQLLEEWNDTAADAPRHLLLHQPFEQQVACSPGRPAVVGEGFELSYGALDARANQLAWELRDQGVGPGVLVGIHLERSPEMIAAVLAVHKAGGAYVPLEVNWPVERVRGILRANAVRHLLTDRDRLELLEELPRASQILTVLISEGQQQPETAPPLTAGPEDLAYVIFTSGSTGQPKGVMVRHQPAVNLVHWVNHRFAVGADDRLLFITALSFDLSVYDIFGTLAAGGSIRLASNEEIRDPQKLVRILRQEPITFWDSAPAALQQCVPFFPAPGTADTALRLAFLSGDWIPVSLPDRIRDAFVGTQVVSLGGATEAVVWSNVFAVDEVDPDWASIPYGRPISNARYYALDADLAPTPVGVAGDLFIGGECLSVGYANQPAQTADQYLPDPFVGEPGQRLYRTGDRARAMTCGNLEFLGRLDTQVKIRGYRIELGEIEAALASHPHVQEGVVLARGGADVPRGEDDRRLVAYFIPRTGGPVPSARELRQRIASQLPEYMVPSAFVPLATWPLSATGKLDRSALPEPERARPTAAPEATPQTLAQVASRQELEKQIRELWGEVLGLEDVGLEENFFDLGGHSLLMAQCHARLQEMLSRELLMVDLFRFPTVASLAQFLSPEPATVASVTPEAPPAAARTSRDVAIVGMAGRFPGARDLRQYWDNLRDGVESIRFYSDDELLASGLDPAVLDDPSYVKARGALEEAKHFDAGFFGMSPREAEVTDPQQRAFLECAWHALENAGYDPQTYEGRIGVYGGVSFGRFLESLLADAQVNESVGRWQILLGNQNDYLASRLSYKLDLTGPSLNVQTACSTSLVAVHLACNSLLQGNCEMALAGGATVNAGEVKGYFYSEGGIDSPDGHTRTFDAAAQGVVPGSGVGLVLLKRLEDAVADGDPIHAVIRASASNNDGTQGRAGFTAPSAGGQARVIREAQKLAGVSPESISYVEAHGTATPLGDPIEVSALNEAFGQATEARGFCALGSVKTNIGHLDVTAGIAGLIKTVLSLQHRRIPPSLHFQTANPECGLDETSPFYVNSSLREWPANGTPRRAGVSSFGIGGTNAHVVLEEAPSRDASGASRPAQLLRLSARTPSALARAAANLADHLELEEDVDLADVAYTLDQGRRAFEERQIVVCRDRASAIQGLRQVAPPLSAVGRRSEADRSAVFLLPGQGAQYAGMGAELYRREPVFRRVVDECCDLLEDELGLDLRELLYPPGGATEEDDFELESTAFAQPALFVIEIALARLWMSWGVQPAALVGHSIGELAAACLAGVFRLEDALHLVTMRGRWMEEQPPGDMLAVGLPEDEIESLLAATDEDLALASVNAPAACVVSGTSEAIARLRDRMTERGVESRRLHTSHAFHSQMMEPIVERFTAEVARFELLPPEIPFVSNVTGSWITDAEATDPAYWGAHLRFAVRFADGLSAILETPGRLLLEVGPGRQLITLARQHSAKSSIEAAVASLPAPKDRGLELGTLLAAVGQLWLVGGDINGAAFWGEEQRQRLPLPGYPFERRPYWPASLPRTIAPGFLGVAETAHSGNGSGNGTGDGLLDVSSLDEGTSGAAETTELSTTEEAVASIWRDMLGVDGLRASDDFFDLGGSSLMAIQLGNRLREALGAKLPGSFLLEASTLGALAQLVERAASGAIESSCLVKLQGGTGRPLFLVHQVGGFAFTFRALARELGRRQPVYGLRSLGLEEGELPLRTIDSMAAHYLERIREVQPRGPYLLGGASMGGMIAYEMAQQLEAGGEQVALLTLMDTPCLDQMPLREGHAEAVAAALPFELPIPLEQLRAVEEEAQLDFVVEQARQAGSLPSTLDLAETRRRIDVMLANVEALYGYVPRLYSGRMLYFRARHRRPGDPPRPELPWIELVDGGVEVVRVPGDHMTMHEEPHLTPMAQHLKRAIELSRQPSGMARVLASPAGRVERTELTAATAAAATE